MNRKRILIGVAIVEIVWAVALVKSGRVKVKIDFSKR